jgi:hypothetical protein
MRLLIFAALSLTAGIPAWTQTVTVQPPDAAGVELIGSQSPEFQGYVQQVLGADGFQGMAEWQPYAVVLKNNSSQTLIGYDIRWGYDGIRGGRSARERSIYGPDANSLKPGAAVVALSAWVLTAAPSAELQASLQRNAALLASLEQTKTLEISLDAAIFASGQFVGPDVTGHFAQDQAEFTAWRGVDVQVQSGIQNGESFDAIAAQLSSINSPLPAPREPQDWNAIQRGAEARRLLNLYQRRGTQALSELVQQHLQQPEIQIYR